MKLLIVSHTAHRHLNDGRVAGFGPTVREIDQLASLFDSVRHVACLHEGAPTGNERPYEARNVEFVPVPPAGGPRVTDKLGVCATLPRYWHMILREIKQADVVHVRCPATISLAALALLHRTRRPPLRWVKYAGNFNPAPGSGEPWAYRVQRRWLLDNRHRGTVTVNGYWQGMPPHVYSFDNPCLNDAELSEARQAGAAKELREPLRLLFVGRVDESKGAGTVLAVAARLKREGIAVEVDLVGDSPWRSTYEAQAAELGLAEHTRFHGWLERTAINPLYAAAHVLLLPTRSEGWAKVLSEGMAHGAVPLASAVSSLPHVLAQTRAGVALPPDAPEEWVATLRRFCGDPALWRDYRDHGLQAAPRFGYTRYVHAVREMFAQQWGVTLPEPQPLQQPAHAPVPTVT